MRLFALTPLALLAACGESDAPGAMVSEAAWTDDLAACGLAAQDRPEWGAGLVEAGHDMQEATAEPGLVLRVWSAADAGLAADGATLSGRAEGPAWVGADIRPETYMVYLADGAADLRVTEEGFFCASTAQTGQ